MRSFLATFFKDGNDLVRRCDICQRVGNISMRKEISLTNILGIEIFYVSTIDFMGSFPQSFGNLYILVVVDLFLNG